MSQPVLEAARAQILAFNAKDWNAFKGTLAADAVYDEIATQRAFRGASEIAAVAQSWGDAFDSKATIESERISGDTAILELTWRGTHIGPMRTPNGDIPATGKKVELRACQIVTV